jgi:hypothetical protein
MTAVIDVEPIVQPMEIVGPLEALDAMPPTHVELLA